MSGLANTITLKELFIGKRKLLSLIGPDHIQVLHFRVYQPYAEVVYSLYTQRIHVAAYTHSVCILIVYSIHTNRTFIVYSGSKVAGYRQHLINSSFLGVLIMSVLFSILANTLSGSVSRRN